MGNTPPNPSSLRLGYGDLSYQVQLGRYAAIHFRGRKAKQYGDGLIANSWQLSYKVGKSTSIVNLKEIKHNDSSSLDIKIDDACGVSRYSFEVNVSWENAETGLLDEQAWEIIDQKEEKTGTDRKEEKIGTVTRLPECIPLVRLDNENGFTSSTTNACGGITDTRFHFYGRGTRLGLMLGEWKKKSKDENPYSGMVAHYYVNTESGEDVGLSVVLKRIGMSHDGHLDFSVDGPEQHPVAALLNMFDQVRRTRTWKPTCCPHCADKIIQRQRADIWQSGSSDSDVDNAPAALLPSCGQNARGLLANDGRFKGNNNGNLNIKHFIVGQRRG